MDGKMCLKIYISLFLFFSLHNILLSQTHFSGDSAVLTITPGEASFLIGKSNQGSTLENYQGIGVEAGTLDWGIFEQQIQNVEQSNIGVFENIDPAFSIMNAIEQNNNSILTLTTSHPEKNKAEIDRLKNQIKVLEVQLPKAIEAEKTIADFKDRISEMKTELEFLKKVKLLTAEENQSASRVRRQLDSIDQEINKQQVNIFLGNVETSRTAYANFSALATTAESVLLFEENTANRIWMWVRNDGIDIFTIACGSIAVNDMSENKNNEAVLFSAITIGLKLIQSSTKNNPYLENITRNIAFSDEIRSLSKISKPLQSISEELYESIPNNDPVELSAFFPSRSQLEMYYKIIDYNYKIQMQFENIRDKAEYLLELGEKNNNMTSSGKVFLKRIIISCNSSINNWSTVETTYRDRYQRLLKERLDRDKTRMIERG